MKEKTVLGFGMCGSFCTVGSVIKQLDILAEQYDILPIMSETLYNTDTRFGKASDFIKDITSICSKSPVHTVAGAEPIGPKKLTDVMVIAPCTGNTLAKLALGITDTSVTMAAKAHLRNGRPLVIALSTNDALLTSGKNIGMLLNSKNVYFVPFSQDDAEGKPRSCIADMSLIGDAVKAALEGVQLQPILI